MEKNKYTLDFFKSIRFLAKARKTWRLSKTTLNWEAYLKAESNYMIALEALEKKYDID